jgi:hypothetical protein
MTQSLVSPLLSWPQPLLPSLLSWFFWPKAMSRLLAKLALICAGVVGLVLGTHGLYICCYFKLADVGMISSTLSSEECLSRLFLAWDVPSLFRDSVLWVTIRGLESWVVPAVLVVAGFVLLRVQKICKVYA